MSVENEGLQHGELSFAQVSIRMTCSQQYFFALTSDKLSG